MSGRINPSQELAQRWFEKAESDLLNVENNLRAERCPVDTVCFHCQQAAEKYLKGFLACHDVPLTKTHDLVLLLAQVEAIAEAEAQMLRPSLLLLDAYSVSVQYPEESELPPSDEQMRAAVNAAYLVRGWVLRQLAL